MAVGGARRRSAFVLAVLAAVVLAAALTAEPAQAQTVTSTQTYTLWNGNTATVVTTSVNGVLSSISYTEVTPSSLVAVQRDISYYPNGQISRYAEVRNLAGGAYQTTLIRDYASTGIVLDQYVKIVSSGQTIAEQFSSYDASGFPLTQQTRILTTLVDGTQVWVVTVQTWSAGVLVSSTTTQYPFGYNFNAPPPPTWPGAGSKGSGAPGQDPNGWRPGNGTGDTQHNHYGAPGQNKKDQ